MGAGLVAATGPSPLWYLTRGAGLVALILLTASVALGVMNVSGWHTSRWPRFATAQLHRNVSLLALVFLGIHILAAELDTFAPVGWLAVAFPFASAYRPVWLGFGTLAFDLVLAVTITSLFRVRVGPRTWRAVHWFAYATWPLALAHGMGTGTDARLGWVQLLDLVCLGAVLATLGWRLINGRPGRAKLRVAAGMGSAAIVASVVLWAYTGPLKAGWARRAGTPTNLLATSRAPVPAARPSGPAVIPATRASPETTGMPSLPFTAALSGRLRQTAPDRSGHITITITTNISGPMSGALSIVLRGLAAGSGVSLESSAISFGPFAQPGEYRGEVLVLDGDQLVASVRSPAGPPIDLGVLLRIDPSTGSVGGSVDARAVAAPASSGPGDDQDGNP